MFQFKDIEGMALSSDNALNLIQSIYFASQSPFSQENVMEMVRGLNGDLHCITFDGNDGK